MFKKAFDKHTYSSFTHIYLIDQIDSVPDTVNSYSRI